MHRAIRRPISQNCRALYLFGGDRERVGPDLIRATRVIRSRITKLEEEWLVERPRPPALKRVPPGSSLEDADPSVAGDLYDDALAVYDHFFGQKVGVGVGKVHKVVHLLRPDLYPILDTRLRKLYARAAEAEATSLRASGARSGIRRAFWAAIRTDLLRNAEAFPRIRDVLRTTPGATAAADLSNVRLLDMVAWSKLPT